VYKDLIHNRIMEGDPTSHAARAQRSQASHDAAVKKMRAGMVDRDIAAAQAEIANVGTGKKGKRVKPVQGELPFEKRENSSVEVKGPRIEEKTKGYHGADQPVPPIDPEILDDSNAKIAEARKGWSDRDTEEDRNLGLPTSGEDVGFARDADDAKRARFQPPTDADVKASAAARKRAAAKKTPSHPGVMKKKGPKHKGIKLPKKATKKSTKGKHDAGDESKPFSPGDKR